MLYMCIEYHIYVNMYHASAQGVDECMITGHNFYLFIIIMALVEQLGDGSW